MYLIFICWLCVWLVGRFGGSVIGCEEFVLFDFICVGLFRFWLRIFSIECVCVVDSLKLFLNFSEWIGWLLVWLIMIICLVIWFSVVVIVCSIGSLLVFMFMLLEVNMLVVFRCISVVLLGCLFMVSLLVCFFGVSNCLRFLCGIGGSVWVFGGVVLFRLICVICVLVGVEVVLRCV